MLLPTRKLDCKNCIQKLCKQKHVCTCQWLMCNGYTVDFLFIFRTKYEFSEGVTQLYG